jgi:hypothetical protein
MWNVLCQAIGTCRLGTISTPSQGQAEIGDITQDFASSNSPWRTVKKASPWASGPLSRGQMEKCLEYTEKWVSD